MAVGDGVTWNEALPDNTTLASEIDDYDRDLRVGVRSRMALEHVWPSAHTGTGSAGRHTYITFQPQTAAPTMAGTTGGGLYVTTEASPRLIFTRSNASDVTIVNTAGVIPIITTGTQGSIVIASSANPTGVLLLAASADGLYLKTHSTTAAPNWGAVTSLDASVIVSGTFGANTVTTTSLKTATGEVSGATGNYTLPGGEYGFYPQVKGDTAFIGNIGYNYTSGSYTTTIGFICSGTAYAQQRYMTASGEDMWIFLLIDKFTKKVIAMWQAPDHPAYGNGNDFDKLPHPFRSHNPELHEIVLIEKDNAKDIQQRAKVKKLSILGLIERVYNVACMIACPYIPIHSGQFSPDNAPVLVNSVPDYIKVRKLVLA